MSTYSEKYDRAMAELAETSMWESNYAPLMHKSVRKLGFKPRPPHYVPLSQQFVTSTAWFGVIWGLFMWWMIWRGTGVSPEVALRQTAFAAMIFGAFLTASYAYGRWKWQLSPWSKL